MTKSDLKPFPYWWESGLFTADAEDMGKSRWDVVVIGAGYTGLNAALTLKENGLDVLVLEAGRIGEGASGRNGGMLGRLLIPGLGELCDEHGERKATELYREACQSLDFTADRVKNLGIECDLELAGRVFPAANQRHLDAQKRGGDLRTRLLGTEETLLNQNDIQADLNSPLYVGGISQPDTGSLHPGKYVTGLAEKAAEQGVDIWQKSSVTQVNEIHNGFEIILQGRSIRAENILMATNGYHGFLHAEFYHRIIPIGSSVIVTEEMEAELVRNAMPTGKAMADSFKVLNYFRPTPDGRRLLIGGRPSIFKTPLQKQAGILEERLRKIFPDLPEIRAEYVWSGNVAYGFNSLPHIGQMKGIYFASGYGGSGVAMSGYMGHKAALKILNKSDHETAFDDLPFETRFYYNGQPWFLPLAMLGYKIKDKLGM
ncbi:FAD-dependent oxidoreductase [Sneathiella sp. P13V-1]|uniref:NAD(P)/FAD-dependent oxidoreductase n=1 Tax=Sneathiella sp. P13V-1 TaxID=2697366 RepID=UPI00187B6CFB|nr:FAD-binding oxidoreductase [Sneathiella sp. P13V-1]MBE7636840.1 FAD-dependent oxidoreductase [Sneathiella sp. P13V-1]